MQSLPSKKCSIFPPRKLFVKTLSLLASRVPNQAWAFGSCEKSTVSFHCARENTSLLSQFRSGTLPALPLDTWLSTHEHINTSVHLQPPCIKLDASTTKSVSSCFQRLLVVWCVQGADEKSDSISQLSPKTLGASDLSKISEKASEECVLCGGLMIDSVQQPFIRSVDSSIVATWAV